MGLCCVLRWHLQPSVPFLVLHRVRAGRPAIHGDPHHSPVPFLVLHRVWAGEGNFEKQSPVPFLVLHRVWTGEGKFQKQSPVPFLVLHRVRGLGDDHRRGGRFIALRVLGFGFRARVKGLGSSV